MPCTVDGKFLDCGSERFWVKGVAYGTFTPTAEGGQFPSREQVADDFAAMSRGVGARIQWEVSRR